MISAGSIDFKGGLTDKVKLPEKVFGAAADDRLTAIAVRDYLSNQRKSAAKTKTRSEVARTTAKMYKQKGTGRARHGAYSAPIFVGGGISHGPDGRQNYKKYMSKKMTKKVLSVSLSGKAAEGKINIISDADKFSGKTKEAKQITSKLIKEKEKLLVVVTVKQGKVRRAFKNLAEVTVVTPNQLNPYTILRNDRVLFTDEGLKEVTSRWEK